MGPGDTAKLLASLDLQDAMSPKLKSAIGNVAGAETAVGRLGTKISGFATSLKGGVSSALTTFGGRLKQLGTGLLALTGIGGAFAIGKTLTDSIGKAQDFGDAAFRLSKIIGGNITVAGKLVDALDYFGVTAETQIKLAGMFEKSIANLAGTSKKAAAFQKTYGLALTDGKGRLNDYNKQLLLSADYFNNKNIPASKKAAALAKLYGRSWQELIPILAQGRAGITKAYNEAITLTQADLDAITKNKEATRAWTDSFSDLQTIIGIKILPVLTDVLKGFTGFIQQHGNDIVAFVQSAAKWAQGIPQFFSANVLPVISTIKSAWDSIPSELRDLLLKGLIADRTIKFLFGISPIKLVASLAADALGGIVKGVGTAVTAGIVGAGIGKAFVQPVWVTNPGFGLAGGVGGAASAAAGAIEGGIAATVSAAAAALAAGAGLGLIMAAAGVWVLSNFKETRVDRYGNPIKGPDAGPGVKSMPYDSSGKYQPSWVQDANGVWGPGSAVKY